MQSPLIPERVQGPTFLRTNGSFPPLHGEAWKGKSETGDLKATENEKKNQCKSVNTKKKKNQEKSSW